MSEVSPEGRGGGKVLVGERGKEPERQDENGGRAGKRKGRYGGGNVKQ